MSVAVPNLPGPAGPSQGGHLGGDTDGSDGLCGDSSVGEPDGEPPALTQKASPTLGPATTDHDDTPLMQVVAAPGPIVAIETRSTKTEAAKFDDEMLMVRKCPGSRSECGQEDGTDGIWRGTPSHDSGISYMNIVSHDGDGGKQSRSLMMDSGTQTDTQHHACHCPIPPLTNNCNSDAVGCRSQDKDFCHHSSIGVATSNSGAEQATSAGVKGDAQDEVNVDGAEGHCRYTLDYSSVSSSDSQRVSELSSRGCDYGSSSSSDVVGRGWCGARRVAATGELSPIPSCGGSLSNVGLSVDVAAAAANVMLDVECSPYTPTSGCLKGGARQSSRAHVQFETPRGEDGQLQQDTSMTSARSIGLIQGSATPTHADPLARFWTKLIPDSSPSDAASSFTVPKKWRRRHVSSSSSGTLSSTSSSSDTPTTEFERRAPDGGWGWVIVAASFMVHCIADGVTMSFGVLFVELLNYFQEGKSLTSWVGSLFMAIPLLAGPLASVLTDRYGCRTVTIVGAIVASFGFFISAFVNTIPLLLLTVGIITGLGLAVCYVAAIVIVAFYFEKKRSLATGIAVAGSGIGTFLFAPLIQHLVDYWGWRLCFIVLAGIFLNMVVCGALMRDLEWTPKRSTRSRDATLTAASSHRGSSSQSSDTVAGRGGSMGTALPSLAELRRLVQSGDVATLLSPEDGPNETLRGSASLVLLPTFLSSSQALPPDVMPFLSSRTNAYEVVSQMYPHLLSHSISGLINQPDQVKLHNAATSAYAVSDADTSTLMGIIRQDTIGDGGGVFPDGDGLPSSSQLLVADRSWDTDSTTPGSANPDLSCIHSSSKKKVNIAIGAYDVGDADNEEEDEEPREVSAMLGPARTRGLRQPGARRISGGCMGAAASPPPSAPLRNMRMNKQSMTYRGAMLNIHRYRLRASSCPDIYRNSIITIAKAQDESVWTYLDDFGEMISSCVDYRYCLDAAYLIFAVSNFVLYVFYDTVYMYLTDYAQGVGVSADESANLISAIGILNCVGMVVMGYVGDQPWSSPMLIYNVSMVVCGASVIVMPFLTNYWLLASAAAVFGLFISANYALTSVILVELISLEAFSKAYGLLLLIQGIANLIGPPLVGFIADTTGDYVMPFVISGIFIIHCGLILNFIPLIKRCQGNYVPSSTSSPIHSPKNGSPATTPNHIHKAKPNPVSV